MDVLMQYKIVHSTLDLFAITKGDPRMDNYFLMESPFNPVIIIFLYVTFVNYVGPRLMKNRQAFELKNAIIAYNAFQILSNTILFYLIARYSSGLSFVCTPIDKSNSNTAKMILNLHYCYMLLKLSDLLDTVFFVLRKKNKQISFLHVHHHIGMLLSAWFTCKYFPGGQAGYVGLYNTFVHAIMYVYYLLTSIRPLKNIWWKKYVTILQIVQHYLIFASLIIPAVNTHCSYPKGIMYIFLFNVILMIHMFTKFYQNTYSNNRRKLE